MPNYKKHIPYFFANTITFPDELKNVNDIIRYGIKEQENAFIRKIKSLKKGDEIIKEIYYNFRMFKHENPNRIYLFKRKIKSLYFKEVRINKAISKFLSDKTIWK